MGKFFSLEGPFFNFMSRVADLLWLNILYIICCLPVITIGASTTALYYVTMKMTEDEEGYISKDFFRSFRLNFKQATLIWLLVLIIGGILAADLAIMTGRFPASVAVSGVMSKLMTGILAATTAIYAFTVTYVFALLAKFDNSVKNTVKNSLLISIRHFPYTILMIVINILPWVLIWFEPRISIFIVILFSLLAFICSRFFVKIFKLYIPKEEGEEDPDDEGQGNEAGQMID